MKIKLDEFKNILFTYGWHTEPFNVYSYINPKYKNSYLYVSSKCIRLYKAEGTCGVYGVDYTPPNNEIEFDEENKLIIIENEVAIKI